MGPDASPKISTDLARTDNSTPPFPTAVSLKGTPSMQWTAARIEVTTKGTSTGPIAKTTRVLATERRAIFRNEAYATRKCSFCRNVNWETKTMYDNQFVPKMAKAERMIL